MRLFKLFVLFAALALGSPSAAARPAPKPERICVSVIQLWRGTLDDVRTIATNPIPERYRQSYDWGGCQQLAKGSLIDWHLAFGDERTTTQALQFLNRTALDGVLAPNAFTAVLPDAWRAAKEAAARQAQLSAKKQRKSQPLSTAYTDSGRYRTIGALRKADAVRRLQPLVEAERRYAFLAAMYVQAAEFFHSQALLDEAGPFLAAMAKAHPLFHEGEPVAPRPQETELQQVSGIYSWTVSEFGDLQMRAAILKAKLSQSPSDLAAAAAVIAGYGDPTMQAAADPLVQEGRNYCQADSASNVLRDSCGSENNLGRRLRSYWRSKAQLDLMTDANAASFDVAWKAIDVAVGETSPERVRYDEADDDHVALLVARADAERREARAVGDSDDDDADYLWNDALDDLFKAERLTPAALNPNRFRQIADRYLTIFASVPDEERTRMIEQPRQAAYFRQVRSELAAIATGGD